MTINRLMWAIIIACLVCSGCGTAIVRNEIEIKSQTQATTGTSARVFAAATDESIITREKLPTLTLYRADTNGVIHIAPQLTCGVWLWQRRPESLSFYLYLPHLSTNGCYHFYLRQPSKWPWRGMQCGRVPVQVTGFDIETLSPTLPAVDIPPATVSALKGAGYRIVLELP